MPLKQDKEAEHVKIYLYFDPPATTHEYFGVKSDIPRLCQTVAKK